jgi:hypothetical protein
MTTGANTEKDKSAKTKENSAKPLDLQKRKVKTLPDIEELNLLRARAQIEEIPRIKEEAAKEIARILVIGFIILLTVPYLYLLSGSVAEVIDLMKTVAAVLSGLVGAVFGYYFRRGAPS